MAVCHVDGWDAIVIQYVAHWQNTLRGICIRYRKPMVFGCIGSCHASTGGTGEHSMNKMLHLLFCLSLKAAFAVISEVLDLTFTKLQTAPTI